MTPLVVDASAAVAFAIQAQATARSEALLDRWEAYLPGAPYVFWLELPWLLLKLERRRREPGLTERSLRMVQRLEIVAEAAPDAEDRHEALTLALRLNIGLYDAMYLALAEQTDAVLATRDGGLATAAIRRGVKMLDLR